VIYSYEMSFQILQFGLDYISSPCILIKLRGLETSPVLIVGFKILHTYSTVQYSTVQYSTVQYSTVQCSAVQYSTVQYSTVQYSTVQYSAVQCRTVQYSAVQCSTVECGTVQWSAVQCRIKKNNYFLKFYLVWIWYKLQIFTLLSNLYLCTYVNYVRATYITYATWHWQKFNCPNLNLCGSFLLSSLNKSK
jgi:hypothetical protein